MGQIAEPSEAPRRVEIIPQRAPMPTPQPTEPVQAPAREPVPA